MHDPLSWSYLTSAPSRTAIWGPFSIVLALALIIGLTAAVSVYLDRGGWIGRHPLVAGRAHRAATVLLPILGLGVLFFIFRVAGINALHLSMRLWLYGLCLLALLTIAWFVLSSIAARYDSSLWGVTRAAVRKYAAGQRAIRTSGSNTRAYRWVAVGLFVFYMIIAVVLYMWRGAYFHPDRWAILLLVTAIVLGQTKAFLRDWIPVVLLLFGYEFMRGIAFQMISSEHRYIHVKELIDADRWLFHGTLPTLWLQHKLLKPGVVEWYGIMAVVVYAMIFVVPLLFAFILWIGSKEKYWNFTLAFIIMTYLGFVIYLLYPAAPPWMASQMGYIHGVQQPFAQVWRVMVPHAYNNLGNLSLWNDVKGNPVAAMPSLHCAFALMPLLYAVKYFGKKGLILLPYNMAVWFAVVYLGQHYVIDILMGILLSSLVFTFMTFAWPRILSVSKRDWRLPRPRFAWAGGLVGRPSLSQEQEEAD
ncbi:MAG TPA: phosphatase PAP2 family protein [Thermomicrobiaceae bacterium]|nr:phosphatase PAP2 family protein [Thermomicrobiaceae bacterium]